MSDTAVDACDDNDRLRAALVDIARITVSGPHVSAKAAAASAFDALDRARTIAITALAEFDEGEPA